MPSQKLSAAGFLRLPSRFQSRPEGNTSPSLSHCLLKNYSNLLLKPLRRRPCQSPLLFHETGVSTIWDIAHLPPKDPIFLLLSPMPPLLHTQLQAIQLQLINLRAGAVKYPRERNTLVITPYRCYRPLYAWRKGMPCSVWVLFASPYIEASWAAMFAFSNGCGVSVCQSK